jgi:translation initiation factor IF-3
LSFSEVTSISKNLRINSEIRARDVRVIDNLGNQLGIIPLREALRVSEEREMDLVEVSPTADPPVCRMMDYGRFKYEQAKKDREAKLKRKTNELKEVTMRPKIDDHDLDVKRRLVKRMLEEGDKVKVTLMFRGREVVYPQLGEKLLEKIYLECASICVVERHPRLEGRYMIMILAPKPEVIPQPPAEPGKPAAEPGKPATEPGRPAAEAARPPAEQARPASNQAKTPG